MIFIKIANKAKLAFIFKIFKICTVPANRKQNKKQKTNILLKPKAVNVDC